MNKKYVNGLANDYVNKKNDDLFYKLYKEVSASWLVAKEKVSKSLLSNEHDVQALYDDVFMKALDRFEGGDFVNLLSRSLKNARCDLFRKNKLRDGFAVYVNNDDDDTEENGVFEDFNRDRVLTAEEQAIKHIQRERDQRKLISSLTDPAKVDTVTTAIVTNFHRFDSITALGKALGINHNTVKRKLRKLVRNYDESRFGDYRDYLAV